jgi:hypothetical protein
MIYAAVFSYCADHHQSYKTCVVDIRNEMLFFLFALVSMECREGKIALCKCFKTIIPRLLKPPDHFCFIIVVKFWRRLEEKADFIFEATVHHIICSESAFNFGYNVCSLVVLSTLVVLCCRALGGSC